LRNPPDFPGTRQVLLSHGVEFVVVGATAAVLQGAPIVTWDLDIVANFSAENVDRLTTALAALDARYRDPAGRILTPTAERLASLRLHLLTTRLGDLDVLRSVGNEWAYADLIARSTTLQVGALHVPTLDLRSVIAAKEIADRPKDRATLHVLRETLRLIEERERS
jgi:hypothetical protein